MHERTLGFAKTDIILIDSHKHSPKIEDFSVDQSSYTDNLSGKIFKTSDVPDLEGVFEYGS